MLAAKPVILLEKLPLPIPSTVLVINETVGLGDVLQQMPRAVIVAPSDQSTGIVWWNGSNVTTGATATVLGAGNANTNNIVAAQGNGSYAAKLCFDLVLNGFSDWYLPSYYELNKLFLNKTAIGAATAYYWSSSEYNNFSAYGQTFTSGTSGSNSKNNPHYVRAVRSF